MITLGDENMAHFPHLYKGDRAECRMFMWIWDHGFYERIAHPEFIICWPDLTDEFGYRASRIHSQALQGVLEAMLFVNTARLLI